MARLTLRKLLLFAINLASTFLTLFTGLRENPLIVFVTGRYDLVRSRLIEGSINYDIVRDERFNISTMPDLAYVGANYRFFSSPSRGPQNLAVDQSVCVHVNAVNSPFVSPYMTINYDDFWGKGPRRSQLLTYSISAPHCRVVNVLASWVNSTCIAKIGGGNMTACHQYILDNFDTVYNNRAISRLYAKVGIPGQVFLKCLGRPLQSFGYATDLLMLQSFWAGGGESFQVQTSECIAKPLVMTSSQEYTLFRGLGADDQVSVVSGSDNSGWFVTLVSILYGIVTVSMIVHGVFAAIVQSSAVEYMPFATRFTGIKKYFKYICPTMLLATIAPEEGNSVVRFKGSIFMASDVWMNHWLYIWLSILDAMVNLRMTYVLFQMATWMLQTKETFSTFLFLCSTLTRLTWLMCLFHSLLRGLCKIAIRGMKSLKFVSREFRERLEWYIDSTALFLSYKVYSIMLFLILYMFLKLHKTTTLMIRQVPPKTAVLGGYPNLARFWASELMGDFVVFIPILTACAFTFSTMLLMTKYRRVTTNGAVRLLQKRYIVVGWDVFVAMESLGMDPFDSDLVGEDNVAMTNCSLGSLLQQLYTSGPSGLVRLAGDYLFEQGGMSRPPVFFRYSIKRAAAIGLYHRAIQPGRYSGGGLTVPLSLAGALGKKYTVSVASGNNHTTVRERSKTEHDNDEDDDVKDRRKSSINGQQSSKSLFDRTLRICTDGHFGRILLVDSKEPGKCAKNPESSITEFVVQDALSFVQILDIKPLLNNEKKLHIM